MAWTSKWSFEIQETNGGWCNEREKKEEEGDIRRYFFVPRLLCFFQILLFPDLYWQPCAQLLETQQPTPPQQNNFQPTSHLDTTWQTETLKYCVFDGMGNGRAKKKEQSKCKHGNTWFLPQWNFYWEQDVTNKKPHQKTATEINIALTLIVPSKMCILHC